MSKKKDVKVDGKGLGKATTRRQFLKVAGVGGLGAASLYLLGCRGEKVTTTGPAQIPAVWDKEVDVVVVGTGTANAASVVAAEAGLKVLALEKAPVFGGHTAYSGGLAMIFNNYLLREQEGNIDSREKSLMYCKRAAEGQAPDELIEAYVDNGNVMAEFFRDKIWPIASAGSAWGRTKGPTTFADYYPHEGTVGGAINRGIRVARTDGKTSGAALQASMLEAMTALGVEIMLETRVKRLIYRGDSNVGNGEVVGVIAQTADGKEIACKARRGVVIGTGSYDHNKDLRQHYLRGPIFGTCSAPTNTGDGLLMAQAVGADLRNMNECWGLPVYVPVDPVWTGVGDAYPGLLPLGAGAADIGCILDWQIYRGKPGAIGVNRKGLRFYNESAAYDASAKSHYHFDTKDYTWGDVPSLVIFAKDYTSHYNLPGQTVVDKAAGVVPSWIKGPFNTLSEVAAAMGIDAAALAATVEKFNGYASNGVDPDYKRGEAAFDIYTAGDVRRRDAGELKNACLAVLEPPYYGAKLWPGSAGTNGGPKTNGNAQILNVWGKVIPRLYAVGNVMASVAGASYFGGGSTIGPGLTFGYLAGKHVATLTPWV